MPCWLFRKLKFTALQGVETARYLGNRGIHSGHALLKCSLNNCRTDSADFQPTHKLMPERSTILGSAFLYNAFIYYESLSLDYESLCATAKSTQFELPLSLLFKSFDYLKRSSLLTRHVKMCVLNRLKHSSILSLSGNYLLPRLRCLNVIKKAKQFTLNITVLAVSFFSTHCLISHNVISCWTTQAWQSWGLARTKALKQGRLNFLTPTTDEVWNERKLRTLIIQY